MKLKLVPAILASATLLTGCLEDKSTPNVRKEDAVASVNGTFISKTTLETLEKEVAERSQGQKLPKEQLLEELIQRELLIQQAKQKKLDQSQELIERLATLKNSLLSQAALQDYLKNNPVSDEDIKAEYDKEMGQVNTEYKARHILVKTEDEAKKLIAELQKGANFAALAKKHSLDQAPEGDLGWFTADRMVPEFSSAVASLENGKFTTTPVKTQFGWHVILREDSKALTPPPLEAVKEQFRPYVQRQKAQKYIEGLRTAAKVEILLEKSKPEETASAASTPADTSKATEAAKP
jgi:peptidyl-prolyl cis-trans isomerase C